MRCLLVVLLQADPTAQQLKMFVRATAAHDGSEIGGETARGAGDDLLSKVRRHNGVPEVRVFIHPSSFNFSEVLTFLCCS